MDGSKPAVRNVVVPEPSNNTVADIVFVVDDGTDGSGVDNVQCRLIAFCIGPSDCDNHRIALERPNGKVVGHDWRACGDQVGSQRLVYLNRRVARECVGGLNVSVAAVCLYLQACRRCDDGAAAIPGQFVPCLRCSVRYELPEGKFLFSALAFDRSLNSNTPRNYTVIVDNTAPQGAVRSGPTQVRGFAALFILILSCLQTQVELIPNVVHV